jgi:RNA polymerase sigma-70 factor (ECF subfamily)
VPQQVSEQIEAVYREDSRRILATLIRLLGDFDLAEDALQEAFRAAMEQWPRDGVPANPRPWLVSAGRFKAIDALRKRGRANASLQEAAGRLTREAREAAAQEPEEIEDDRLRLIFTCAHPALPPEARVALTLREVCGLSTEQIAQAFLTSPTTLAQRIVRAKARVREAGIPYEVPTGRQLPERLEAVLQVIYLVFNEGYSASSGESVTRPDLTAEAIRLGRLLVDLLPEPEAMGLLGLMLLHESRRAARSSSRGELILLEDQDRALWSRELIDEGTEMAKQAWASGRWGMYTLQAAIAAQHAAASSLAATDWARIATLYDLLLQVAPSPVIEISRAVAMAMRDGPETGLELMDAVLTRGELENYHLAYSARAEMFRRLGRVEQARSDYRRALALAQQEPERRLLERRLAELER